MASTTASASTSRPQSVRGLYTPPAEEWVFLPPSVQPPSSQAGPAPTTPSHLPTPFSDSDSDMPVSTGLYGPLQLFAAEYFTMALSMPFDVGKTLLQVEYRPRKRFAPVEEVVEEKMVEEPSLDTVEDAEMYFTERLAEPSQELIPPPPPAEDVDASGYFPELHPSWLLKDDPDISRGNGVWGMIRRLRQTPSEGLPALWKSQLVSTFHSILTNLLQPHIHTSLTALSPSLPPINPDLPLTAIPSPGIPLALGVTSHFLTHLLLSPMEIVRTRLIVMPLSHASTPSSVGIFKELIEDEGGFAGTYFNSALFIPTVLEHTIRPLLTLSIPLLLERQFGLSPELSPVTYSMCDLGLGLASLVVMLPIETVRKRLQLQKRSTLRADGKRSGKKMKSIVKLREREYVGVVEAIWRIVTEETGVRRKRVMSERDEGGVFAGIRQLYRGFGMAATAHLTVFGLGLVSAGLGGSVDGGWKEI